MLPRIKLTDLLLEVASWTGFDEQFIHASTNRASKLEEKSIVLAALMAKGDQYGINQNGGCNAWYIKWQMLLNGECTMM
ncbi:hypothetical protein J2Y03_004847 [Neobacillus niacini]|nr:hypothetical protein [Neobacillus niacini]